MHIVEDIQFSKPYQLVKYYPYLVAVAGCSEDKCSVYLSENSYIDERKRECRKFGHDTRYLEHYEDELAKEYLEVAKWSK